MKKNVAVIYGGYSSEYDVSKKSADTIYSNIDTSIYTPFLVEVTELDWKVQIKDEFISIDKQDFTFLDNQNKITFDIAFITIHGTPGEDGKLQAYFDMIGLLYVNSGVFASSLTFNKWACNEFLSRFGIHVAKSVLLRKLDTVDAKQIGEDIGFPCFVKPNDGGSSFGISKVKKTEDLADAISKAFLEGNEVIIESLLNGREVTCGMYNNGSKIIALPITEILTDNDFFDYEAKYNGESNEITPADISEELTLKIQSISIKVYTLLGLKAFARIDYFVDNENKVSLIEVNTNPGMTKESLVPQQVEAAGLKLKNVLTEILKL